MAALIFLEGPAAGRRIELPPRATVGRLPGLEVQLEDPSVSRRHARLLVQGERILIRDLGSANGTFVNGRRVESAVLADGDEVRFGRVRLRVASQRMPAPREASSPLDFEVRRRERLLQFSPYARAPREGGLLTSDWEQRSGLEKLLLGLGVLLFCAALVWATVKAVGWLLPAPVPPAAAEEP